MSEPTSPPAAPASAAHATGPAHEAHDGPHDEFHVHAYEHSGIREGNARVPLWLVGAILVLFGFFAWYVATQWNAQPSSARMR